MVRPSRLLVLTLIAAARFRFPGIDQSTLQSLPFTVVRSVKKLDLTRAKLQKARRERVNPRTPFLFVALVTITWSFVNPPASGLRAVPVSEARVTQVNNSVELSHPMRAPHRARLNEIVDQETVVRTGKKHESH